MSRISIICALAENNRAIGKNNQLLWNIPADLKRFKELTEGHPVIMGLNTFKSLPFILPNRTNIVLTPEKIEIPGVIIANSIDEAVRIAQDIDKDEIFIIGGGYVYSQTISMANRLYLTLVEGDYEADVYFPDYSEYKNVIKEESGESNGYIYKYLTLEK